MIPALTDSKDLLFQHTDKSNHPLLRNVEEKMRMGILMVGMDLGSSLQVTKQSKSNFEEHLEYEVWYGVLFIAK